MAVDISTDLNITLLARDIKTPAITQVDFILSFTAPALYNVYTSFAATDVLHPALTIDPMNVTVKAEGAPVAAAVSFHAPSNMLTVNFSNTAATAGKLITIDLPATVADAAAIPADNITLNSVRLTLNSDARFYGDSNTAEVRFTPVPVPPGRCRAVTDVLASVAMEQRALAHILDAEGAKLRKALSMALTLEQTLAVNRSATSLVEAVSGLEHILKRKLNAVNCDLCALCTSDTDDET